MAAKESIEDKLAKDFYEAAEPMLDVLEIAREKQWELARKVVAQARDFSPDESDESLTETFEIVKNVELKTLREAADNKVAALLGPGIAAAAKGAANEDKKKPKPPAAK